MALCGVGVPSHSPFCAASRGLRQALLAGTLKPGCVGGGNNVGLHLGKLGPLALSPWTSDVPQGFSFVRKTRVMSSCGLWLQDS